MFTDELFEKDNISYDIQDGKIFMIFKSEGKEFVKTLDSFKEPLKTALLDAYVPKKYHPRKKAVINPWDEHKKHGTNSMFFPKDIT